MRSTPFRPFRPGTCALLLTLAASGLVTTAMALGTADATQASSERVLDTKSARALGLSPGWQTRLPTADGVALQGLHATGAVTDSVYVWDRSGVMMKVDPKTGELRWQSAGVFARGATGLIDAQTVMVRGKPMAVGLGDVQCLVLDERTGIEQGLTPYERIPVTRAVLAGSEFVFGSRAGQVVWLGLREERIPSQVESRAGDAVTKSERVAAVHVVPYEVQAFQLGGSIQAPPIVAGKMIVACSSSGQINAFSQETRQPVWRQKLPGGIVAQPSADATQLMVACRDQYLRSMDIETGRTNWRWFTESPLERSPLLAGDIVTLQVPDLGLVALDASDSKSLNRTPLWTTKVGGDAITRLTDGLIVWDGDTSTLSLVDHKSGKVRESRSLAGQGVVSVQATAALGGDLYLLMKDGRLQRCTPLTPFVAPAKPAASAPEEPATQPEAAPATAETPAEAPTDAPAPADAPAGDGN